MIGRLIIIFFLNILDTSLRSIENKMTDLSKHMMKMSRTMQHIVSSSGTVVSTFLVSISSEIDYSRDHIISIIIEIQIIKKHFQI